ncbi:methyl-accepting chemotaxis protein [Treponema primitia]|nr:methyl-accepting chemotaxis protein [Treponema primitia]
MLRNISIGVRIIAIIAILILSIVALMGTVFFTAQGVKDAGISRAETVMLEGQREKLKLGTQSMAIALGRALEGITDPQEQHDIISKYIKDYRFEEDQSGYYFTYKGTVIFMHPTLPQREGEDLGNTPDAMGVLYVRELYENAQKGGGFVSFIFPKPGPNGNMVNAPKLAYVEFIPGTDIWISTGIYIDNIDAYKTEMEQNMSADLNRQMIFIIICCAALLVILLGPLCVFTLRSITKPLRETVQAAEQLASGKLDIQITAAGKDEITVLQKSFIRMSQNLQSSFSAVQAKEEEATAKAAEAEQATAKIMEIAVKVEQAAHDVENSVTSISRSATKVKSGGDAQTERINDILSSVEQLSSQVFRITDSAGTAAEKSEESNKKVEAGVSMAQESGGAMEALHSLTGTLTENITRLGEQSNNIGSIMNVISDIADQINLLAMNASIEAAHAGESGRGFAVVAGEVRKLAEKTMSAAKEVESSISEMQKLTKTNITGMDNAVASISQVTNLSGKTVGSLSSAQKIVEEAMIQVQSIAQAVQEQSAFSKSITTLVNDVSGITKENNVMVTQVDSELQSLLRKSEELLELVQELRS